MDDAIVREESRLNVGSEDGTRKDVEDYQQLQEEEARLKNRIETANRRVRTSIAHHTACRTC